MHGLGCPSGHLLSLSDMVGGPGLIGQRCATSGVPPRTLGSGARRGISPDCHGQPWAARRQAMALQAMKARWTFDVRFGRKTEAIQLLKQWVRDVGSEAGLSPSNTCIVTGAVGAPESRLELEVEVADMSELERVWRGIPAEKHGSWARIVQDIIVDGTPKWEVFQIVSIKEATNSKPKGSVRQSSPVSLELIDDEETAGRILYDSSDTWKATPPAKSRIPTNLRETSSGLSIVENMDDADFVLGDASEGSAGLQTGKSDTKNRLPLDWKGDPMQINPGDKIPRIM